LTNDSSEGDNLSSIECVFEEIASQSWFDPEARYPFSRYLVETFPDGSYNPRRHRQIVEEVARTLFQKKLERKR